MMQFVAQKLDDILESLQPLSVDWRDATAKRVITEIEAIVLKKVYAESDLVDLLNRNFTDALLIFRLFLGLSKDQFGAALLNEIGGGPCGIKSYKKDPKAFLEALIALGVLESMSEQANRAPKWTDVLVERLRSGRGSAISGQLRGRGVEDFAEAIVKSVFSAYSVRCTFRGPRGKSAKCDFAIPSKDEPRIVIEAKGYGATGSKMTDVIGDVVRIIEAKRPDTAFLLFTDGVTWRQRKNDLRRLLVHQNVGEIQRIYTHAMADQFERDIRQLKREYAL